VKIIIGIAGPAGSGKDTVADYIISQRPEYVKMSFADPIKEMLFKGLKLMRSQLHGSDKEEMDARYERTPRYIMQSLGTDWGRKMIHPDIWVNAMYSRVIGPTVISDVRFENEAEFIRQQGTLIHIMGRKASVRSHASEDGVKFKDGEDILLRNDSDLRHLYALVNDVVEILHS
jgi:hypothetical protein